MLKNLNLGVRFILEVVALISLGYWGFKLDTSAVNRIFLGIGLPLVIAIIWGVFGSPKAIWQLSKTYRWILLFGIYILSTLALYTSGKKLLAIIFILSAIVNSYFMYIWKQQ